MSEEKLRLCFRCEYRAQYLETGSGPRCECQQKDEGVYSCYMYRPITPYVTRANDPSDKRPRHAPAMFSAREQLCRKLELNEFTHLVIRQKNGESVVFCLPKDVKGGNKNGTKRVNQNGRKLRKKSPKG